MPNEHLKDALSQAGLTIEQFAEIIEVDPKTVQRWVNGRTPYPRHREKIARALDLNEHQLWPDAVPADANADEPLDVDEITGAWPHGEEDGAPEPVDLLGQPAKQIDVLDPDGYLFADAAFRTALRHQPAGAAIRVLGPGWAADTEPIVQDGPRLLAASAVPGLTFVRVDDTILIVLALPSPSSPPTIRIDRQHDDGLFDQLVDGFETLWNTIPSTDTTPPLPQGSDAPTPQQLSTAQSRRWPGREP